MQTFVMSGAGTPKNVCRVGFPALQLRSYSETKLQQSTKITDTLCSGLSAGTIITNETNKPNKRVLLAWGLYFLVVLFLLFYLICASVPREETLCLSQLQRNLLVITKCMAEFSYTDLCTIVMSLALLKMLRRVA